MDIITKPDKQKYDINDLLQIVKELRVHCPWDREQTHTSTKKNVLEEAEEVAEAIDILVDTGNYKPLQEELGDLLLQAVFQSEISSDFDFSDIVDGICKKLIYRHPHVYGDVVALDTKTVLSNWEKLKAKEKKEKAE